MDFDELNIRKIAFEHAVGHVLSHHFEEMITFIRGGISVGEFAISMQEFIDSVNEWHREFTDEERRLSGYDDIAPPAPSDLPAPF